LLKKLEICHVSSWFVPHGRDSWCDNNNVTCHCHVRCYLLILNLVLVFLFCLNLVLIFCKNWAIFSSNQI